MNKHRYFVKNDVVQARASVWYSALWFVIRRRIIYMLLFILLIILFVLFIVLSKFDGTKTTNIYVLNSLFSFLSPLYSPFLNCYNIIMAKLALCAEALWEVKSTILSSTFTVLTMTNTITSFVFDGKSIAGVKKETINCVSDRGFLHTNKLYFFAGQFIIILALILKYKLILLLAFIFITFLVAVQLQLCLCYSAGKQVTIYSFSLNILPSIVDSIKQLLEYGDNSSMKYRAINWLRGTRVENFAVLANTICSPFATSTVTEQAESKQLILGVVKHTIEYSASRKKQVCVSVSKATKLSMYKFLKEYDVSAIFYPFYLLFYFLFTYALSEKEETDDKDSIYSFLENAVFMVVDSLNSVWNKNRARAANTEEQQMRYFDIMFYSVAGLLIGSLEGGCSMSVVSRTLENLRYYLISFHGNNKKESLFRSADYGKWREYIRGIASIVILWNEDSIRCHNYYKKVEDNTGKLKKEYVSGVSVLFNLMSSVPTRVIAPSSTFETRNGAKRDESLFYYESLDKFLPKIKPAIFWWLISNKSASAFPGLKADLVSVYGKTSKMLDLYGYILKHENFNGTIESNLTCNDLKYFLYSVNLLQ